MKRHLVSALSLSSLLLACAHGKSEEPSRMAAEHEREQLAANREPARTDGVDVPERRENRQLASAGDELENKTDDPANKTDDEGEHAADNTGTNERDSDGSGMTPLDQGTSEIDVDLTQRIRKAVMAEDSLSFTAKNVKIITREGRVVLRGPVNDAKERDTIAKLATSHAGVGRVTNQLEVKGD